MYVAVEGHGEAEAIVSFLARLTADLALAPVRWRPPLRQRGFHADHVVTRVLNIVRAKRDADGLLIFRDADDECPRAAAPRIAALARGARLPFPVATVLAEREFESLFLASLPTLAGKLLRDPSGSSRPGIRADAHFEVDPAAVRGAKEWISAHMPRGRIYKPSVDQRPLAAMVDFSVVRSSSLRWFHSLERALRFLSVAAAEDVYPRSDTATTAR